MIQQAHVNVSLILVKGHEVLLCLRENTGYEDGKWALPLAQPAPNESAKSALIKSAHAQLGITIDADDLETVHTMHRNTKHHAIIDLFMVCTTWQGHVGNMDDTKCGHVKFFKIMDLPPETASHIKIALINLQQKKFYHEHGW